MIETRRAWYRFQGDVEKIETGKAERNFIEMCWKEILVDTSTGKIYASSETGITRISLADYPEVKNWIELGTPVVIAAAEAEFIKQQDSSDQPSLETEEQLE